MKKQNKFIVVLTLIILTSLLYGFSSDGETKLVTIRTFEAGEGLNWKSELNIVYEDGRTETIKLEGVREKYRIQNQLTITQTLNKFLAGNYKLASSSASEIQGCLITNYVFLK